MQKLRPAWVERIFARMAVRYGSAWMRLWEGVDIEAVKDDWAFGLGGFGGDAIHYALGYLPIDRPPTLGQFRETCTRAPEPKRIAIAAPPADPGRVAVELQRMRDSQQDRSRLQWALDLQSRDHGGERLTEAQRAAYRLALERTEIQGAESARFSQIPCDTLPPAMRPMHLEPTHFGEEFA